MGLDMYLSKEKITKESSIVDDDGLKGKSSTKETFEIAYWRKHNRLHGFMANLWLKKNPKSANVRNFNGVPLTLSKENINTILEALVHETMPPTQGFFFGTDHFDRERNPQDIKLFQDCLGLQEQGWTIIYNSWW